MRKVTWIFQRSDNRIPSRQGAAGKVELTEDNASKLEEFSKEWKDANDKWNAMWGVKIEQTEDGRHYVAGLGLSMEDTEEGKLSQFLVAANRIAFIDPANGNETPMFVAQGNQIFMNEVFLKYLDGSHHYQRRQSSGIFPDTGRAADGEKCRYQR